MWREKKKLQTCFSLKLKAERRWMVSQTSEWKMSSVIFVSAARSLADVALWLQSPFEMELGWVGEVWGGGWGRGEGLLSQLSGI